MAITENGVLKRDDNDSPVMGGTSSVDNATIINSAFDPTTRRLLTDSSGSSGTVTSVSVVTANGVSGTVATATTTPAITLTLGAITPSAVQVSGLTASQILSTDASKNLTSLAVATYPSLTELTYVKGVTSAIQTQIDAKMTNPMTTGGDVIYGGASGSPTRLANGSAGQVLQSNGTTLAPTWVAAGAGDMVLASVQTVTGAKTFGTIGGAVGKFILAGSTSGSTILDATATAGAGTVTLPTTGTLVTLEGVETLTNKSISGGQITSAVATATDTVSKTGTGSTYATTASPTLTTPVLTGLPTGTGVATANTVSTLVARDASGNFAAGTITAALTGNASTATSATSATTATNATNTAITDDTTTNATMYPTWVTTTTGNLPQKVSSSKLTFNPSTAALTTTTFVGALTGTASGNLVSGGALGTPSSGTATNITGLPAAAVLAGTLGTGAYVMDTKLTVPQLILTANAITASANAATVPVTSGRNVVTNNSAATLTITMTTASAANMQTCIVRVFPSSAVAQTLTFVNTENSAATSVPSSTGSSVTIPISVGFIYNAVTSLWTCVASS